MPGTLQLCHLPGQEVGTCRWTRSLGTETAFPSPYLSRELPTPWWWEPWPSWTSAWRSCSPSSSPEAPAQPSSGFGCCLFTSLTCLFLFSSSWLFFSPLFLSLLPSHSFLLPLCFCLLLFLSSCPFRFSHLFWICLSSSLSSPPCPTSLSRLFTYEGLFSLRVALFSETHKSKSDHCPMSSPPFL